MDKIENNCIPYWDPLRNKIIWINKKDCEKIQKVFNKSETECPNFEARVKEQ